MRGLLMGLGVAAITVCLTAFGTDFGLAIYAEYRLSRTVHAAAQLPADPFVAILKFPFTSQARAHRYTQVEIKAAGVDQPVIGRSTLEATLHDVDLTQASWLIRADAAMAVAEMESRIIIDSTHLGRYFGITDLMVAAPPPDTNDATGGTTESGISSSHGLVFTGTPKAAGVDERVSVSVDVAISGPDRIVLQFTATGILTGPGTADHPVSDDARDAVLAAFTTSLPGQTLPFGITPTRAGARGSDTIIEGIAYDVTVAIDEFRQP